MRKLSQTEENYLKAIYHIGTQNGQETVSTNALAENLQTTPASVNDMMKKLFSKKLINYQKYKGASLLPEGEKHALAIIRKHRLWEVFLVDTLDFRWDEVHEIAEQLEHIRSPLLIERLDSFLGNPTVDPHGDPIPDANGVIKETQKRPLSELTPGIKGIVVAVNEDNSLLLNHLDQLDIQLGSKVEVTEVMPFDGSMNVRIDHKNLRFLSRTVAENLLITVLEK